MLSPSLEAGLLLAARRCARTYRLAHPPVTDILDATTVSRSRAYERRDEILEQLGALDRPPGRPPAPQTEPAPHPAISREVLAYVMAHPGCVEGQGARRRYSDGLRRFVVELAERHPERTREQLAHEAAIPTDTLADWLRHPTTEQPTDSAPPAPHPAVARLETLLDAWRRWEGSFTTFCDHVQEHLHLHYGRTQIATLLDHHGLRTPRRRPGRRPDEKALRESFETFFPGAQWAGDGTPLTVELWGQRFTFNLELMVDTHSAALVGADLRPHEDAHAVIAAHHDGVHTTGESPIAVLLDHRPSNLTPEVEQQLDPTIVLPATKGRPQNKAHVEGAFGLFAQVAPPLELTAHNPADLAAEILRLIVQTWARTLNHRPRRTRAGRTRVELYRDDLPTPDQVEQARQALEQRLRQQRRAAETRRARLDPVVRQALAEAFERLSLEDATGHLRDAIAGYPPDQVLAAIAIFEGKREAGTLPPTADGRYLLGIARNLTALDEGLAIAEALWKTRLEARDTVLLELDNLRQRAERDLDTDPAAVLRHHLDQALDTDRRLDRLFWIDATAGVILRQPKERLHGLFRTAARRIHATHRVAHRDRLQATRLLARKILPLA